MRDEIERQARRLIAQDGIINLTRETVCDSVGIPPGSFKFFMRVGFLEWLDTLILDDQYDVGVDRMRLRANPTLRKKQVLNAAIEVAKLIGYQVLTPLNVAKRAGVSRPLVVRYFKPIGRLRDAVMRQAVADNILLIIAQGLVVWDPIAEEASLQIQKQALSSIIND